MTNCSASQMTLIPLSMVFVPTTAIPQSLVSERTAAGEELHRAITALHNFHNLLSDVDRSEESQKKVQLCQARVTTAAQSNNPRLLSQVFSEIDEALESMPYLMDTDGTQDACSAICKLATEKTQRLSALSYATMCASVGDTLATDQMNDPEQIVNGWREVLDTYG